MIHVWDALHGWVHARKSLFFRINGKNQKQSISIMSYVTDPLGTSREKIMNRKSAREKMSQTVFKCSTCLQRYSIRDSQHMELDGFQKGWTSRPKARSDLASCVCFGWKHSKLIRKIKVCTRCSFFEELNSPSHVNNLLGRQMKDILGQVMLWKARQELKVADRVLNCWKIAYPNMIPW